MRYLAFDIGCIECGEPSGVIGFFATEEEAVDAAELAKTRQKDNWEGQHTFRVFDLESEDSYSQFSR
jgi:hypothetical protein